MRCFLLKVEALLAVGIIFIRKHRHKYEVLIQHRPNYIKNGGNRLSIVTGGMDKGEKSIESAYREASEETQFNKYCSFSQFKKYAIRLTKGTFNCYLFYINKVKTLKKWKPKPEKEFKKELDTRIFKHGHVWVPLNIIYQIITFNDTINHVYMWDLTKNLFREQWRNIIDFMNY